jgi:chemotaxis protein CheX
VRAEYLNPFVEGLQNVFTMMLGLHPERQALRICAPMAGSERITSLIGITGQVSGMVALRFPPDTARQIAGRFLGNEIPTVDDNVLDAVSELVNMIAGQAKSKFEHDPPLRLGLPTVVQGSEYRVKYPSKSVWLEVPYQSEVGEFSMEVTYSASGD